MEVLKNLPFPQMVELMAPALGQIQPGLTIIGNRMQLGSSDSPFILAINKNDHRIGLIEVLEAAGPFPGQILTHFNWVSENRFAISNLNRSEFNLEKAPFLICLTPSFPEWKNLLTHIRIDLGLYQYQIFKVQENPLVLFQPLYLSKDSNRSVELPVESGSRIRTEKTASSQTPIQKPALQPASQGFQSEGFYDSGYSGMTEEEVRFFSN